MRYVVVVESAFGNTRQVAEAVTKGLGDDAQLFDVADAPPLQELTDVELLVVGGPTHAFGMSRPQTREDAADKGGRPPSTGIREWLGAAGPVALRAATLDTHTRSPNLPGTASRAAAKRLRALGCTMVADPEKFWVHGGSGPLLEGERERALRWGAGLRDR